MILPLSDLASKRAIFPVPPEYFTSYGLFGRAMIYSRVSTPIQQQNQSLARQENKLLQVADEHSLEVIDRFREVGSASGRLHRQRFDEFIKACKDRQCMGVVESVDRMLRTRDFNPHRDPKRQQLKDKELQALRDKLDSIVVGVVEPLEPSARAAQTKRGMINADSKGGRPRRSDNDETIKLAMTGMGLREIAAACGLSHEGVRKILQRAGIDTSATARLMRQAAHYSSAVSTKGLNSRDGREGSDNL